MIEQQTIIDQIEIVRNGAVQIRFGLLVVENGVEIAHQWHRTLVEPGGDVDAQIAAVNTHLVQMNRLPCPATETARVKAIAQLVHTAEVVRKFRDEQARRDRLEHGPVL